MRKKLLTGMFFGFVFIALSTVVLARTPHQFYGEVIINGNPAPAGLLIVTKIDGADPGGTTGGTTVTAEGTYGLAPNIFYIEDPNGDREGKTIQFFVNNIFAGESIFGIGDDGEPKRNTELDLSITGDICGDNACTSGESCSSCSLDCGTCPGGNGNGGGPRGGPGPTTPPDENDIVEPQCTENWECTKWFDCSNGKQRRVCVDRSLCGTTTNKPSEIQNCELPVVPLEDEEENLSQPPTTEASVDGITGFITGAIVKNLFAVLIGLVIVIALGMVLYSRRLK